MKKLKKVNHSSRQKTTSTKKSDNLESNVITLEEELASFLNKNIENNEIDVTRLDHQIDILETKLTNQKEKEKSLLKQFAKSNDELVLKKEKLLALEIELKERTDSAFKINEQLQSYKTSIKDIVLSTMEVDMELSTSLHGNISPVSKELLSSSEKNDYDAFVDIIKYSYRHVHFESIDEKAKKIIASEKQQVISILNLLLDYSDGIREVLIRSTDGVPFIYFEADVSKDHAFLNEKFKATVQNMQGSVKYEVAELSAEGETVSGLIVFYMLKDFNRPRLESIVSL